MTRCIHLRAWLVKYGMRAQKEKTARSKNIPGGKMVEFSFSDDFSEFLRKRHMWQRPNTVDTAETAMTKRILQMLDTLSTIDFCSCPTQFSLSLRSLRFGGDIWRHGTVFECICHLSFLKRQRQTWKIVEVTRSRWTPLSAIKIQHLQFVLTSSLPRLVSIVVILLRLERCNSG